MSRVDFYHLQNQTLEEVLPKLLQKAYSTGKHVVVKVGTPERVEFLNTELWTFSEESFLPHGSKKDGFAAQQPVWLTSEDENPNESAFLFLTDGAEIGPDKLAEYERIFNIFDGNSEEALVQARNLWKKFKESGNEVYYWQQTEKGVWEQKA